MAITFVPFKKESPFLYTSRNGTRFTATRCDFEEGVKFETVEGLSEAELLQDVAEMIGYHATNILENLNGFQGYDTVEFVRST